MKKLLFLVTLALAGLSNAASAQVLNKNVPQRLEPFRHLFWQQTVTSRNSVRYELTDAQKVWSVMFVADGAGRLVGIQVLKNGDWVVCGQLVGDAWSEAPEAVIKPGVGMSIDVAAWAAFFRSSVAKAPHLIESFQGFQGIALEGDAVWKREVGLVSGDRSGVVRLRNVKTGEQRLISEFEFGVLPPVGKDFRLGLSCGLFYAVVGTDDDSKGYLVVAQALEASTE